MRDVEIFYKSENLIIFQIDGCNICCFFCNDKCFVVDSGFSFKATLKVVEYIENVLNFEIEFLFNTHSHIDHINGNAAFNCRIISSQNCFINQKTHADLINNENSFCKHKLPNQTFNQSKEMDFSNLTLKFNLVGGHTQCSSILTVVERKICFVGDNAFGNKYPIIFPNSNPTQIVNILDNLLKSQIELFIPGHGKILTKKEIGDQLKYWSIVVKTAKNISNNGETANQLLNDIRLEGLEFQKERHKQNVEYTLKFFDTNT